jgi:hypothetical protein
MCQVALRFALRIGVCPSARWRMDIAQAGCEDVQPTLGWAWTRPAPTWVWVWLCLASLGVERGHTHTFNYNKIKIIITQIILFVILILLTMIKIKIIITQIIFFFIVINYFINSINYNKNNNIYNTPMRQVALGRSQSSLLP